MPIHHSKIDTKGMARINKAIADGPYPLVLAPEGQVSYFADHLPHIESGVVRIGYQTAQNLADKNIDHPVEILPIGIHMRYDKWGKKSMDRLLKKIEKFCGFTGKTSAAIPFGKRLSRCRDYILVLNENRYSIKNEGNIPFEERLEKVINASLETAERMLGIQASGDFFARLYKVRQICWDRIFLPDLDDLDNLTYAERNMLDLKAGEAWYIARHQEIADFSYYFKRPVPDDDAALPVKIEYVQNLWDFTNRTMGGAFSGRVNIFPAEITIQAVPVINLSKKLSRYREDKKAAVAETMTSLEKIFLDMLV